MPHCWRDIDGASIVLNIVWINTEAVPKLCPSLAILANLSVLAPRRINKMSVINTGGECNSHSRLHLFKELALTGFVALHSRCTVGR